MNSDNENLIKPINTTKEEPKTPEEIIKELPEWSIEPPIEIKRGEE